MESAPRFPGWNFRTECRVPFTFCVVCTSSRSTVRHRDVPGPLTTKWNNFLPIGNSTFAPTEISGFFFLNGKRPSFYHGDKIEQPAELRISHDPLRFRAFSRRGAKSGKCVIFKVVVVVVFYLFADILIVQWPIRAMAKKQNGRKKLKISIVPDPRLVMISRRARKSIPAVEVFE